jgi:membrane protein DedA with SNARE-associated domain
MLTSLAHWVQDTVAAHGLTAVFVLMMLEAACIPIPSEVTMIYAGYLVSQHTLVFWQAVAAGVAGELVGSLIAWTVGAYGVDAYLLRSARSRHHLELAHRWFDRYGTPAVFFSRLLPVLRTFISLPAGIARMPLARFIPLTVLGSLIWCTGLVFVGYEAGANWQHYQNQFHYLDYVVALAVVGVVGFWLLRRRRRALR